MAPQKVPPTLGTPKPHMSSVFFLHEGTMMAMKLQECPRSHVQVYLVRVVCVVCMLHVQRYVGQVYRVVRVVS